MPPVGRKLHDIIPPDVRARASKSGVSRFDWYAGRTLDGMDEHAESAPDDLPPGEIERLRGVAKDMDAGGTAQTADSKGVLLKLRHFVHHFRLRGHRA